MSRNGTSWVVLVGLLLVGLGCLLYLQSGPRAAVPSEDPLVRLNREHADISDNAAEIYAAAHACLTRPPSGKWYPNASWRRGDPVPPEAIAWVDGNAEAVERTRAAAAMASFWAVLERDENGDYGGFVSEMRDLTRLFQWRARIAAEQADWETYGECMWVNDRVGQHLSQVPILIQRICGTGFRAWSQAMLLDPYTWPSLTDADRAAYASHVAECLEPSGDYAEALAVEQELFTWMWMDAERGLSQKLTAAVLCPASRVSGEVDRSGSVLRGLASEPVEEQANPANPLRERLHQIESQQISRFNVPRNLVWSGFAILEPSLNGRVRLIAMQRGNRTAIEIFALRDRTGRFPETLEEIAGDFKFDPFTGRPFVYCLTEDGFTLYSAGLDRDDDGGVHNARFGVQPAQPGKPEPPPDGDYVFWPISAPTKKRP